MPMRESPLTWLHLPQGLSIPAFHGRTRGAPTIRESLTRGSTPAPRGFPGADTVSKGFGPLAVRSGRGLQGPGAPKTQLAPLPREYRRDVDEPEAST